MNIATRKIEVRINESDKEIRYDLYKFLRDIEYHTYKYANQIIQLNFFKDTVKSGIGNTDSSLSPKELSEKISELIGCSERNFGYKFIKKEHKDKLPSTIRTTLNSMIYGLYNNDKSEVFRGNQSIRSYKRGLPTPFQKTAINDLKEYSDGNFTFDLFKIPFITRLGSDRSNNKVILGRIISGEYQMCDSSFQFKNNKLFF